MSRLLLVLTLALSGCATLDRYEVAETTFHTLNAIDQAQSVNAISHDCYHEADPFTSQLLGQKPASGDFALYGLVISLAFNAFNRLEWVQERPALRATVDVLAIGAKGWQVAKNHSIGMRVSGANTGCQL